MRNHKKVIHFPQSPPPEFWTFYDYVEEDSNPIEEWYQKELSDEGRYMMDSLLKAISKAKDPSCWIGFKYLKGKMTNEKVWQLDFKAYQRQYRLLGVFGQGPKRAALLIGCYHKGDVYTPHNAFETALKRAKNLREGRAGKRERKIRTDL